MVNIRDLGANGVSPEDYHERYRIEGLKWADLEAAAKSLEGAKDEVFNDMTLRLIEQAELKDEKLPFNRAEAEVKRSRDWRKYRLKMNDARHEANKQKIVMKHYEHMIHKWQSENATRRVEIQTLNYGT